MTELILNLTSEQESAYRRKIIARNRKLAEEKAREAKKTISNYLPSDFIRFCRLKAIEAKKTNYSRKSKDSDFYETDKEGRTYITVDKLTELNDAEALKRHGNDPDKRFDEWNFPGTAAERRFLLKHDFGNLLTESLETLEIGSWVYAYGEVGNGKTALAMRCAWELLKTRLSQKASFVSMNQYSLDQIQRENLETAAIRRGDEVYSEILNFREIVILDDFDKVNYSNIHKGRTMLDLVERLKKGRHRVFVTSQISLAELYRRYEENWDMKPIIDRLRQMCLPLPEFKEKSKRRFGK